MSSENTYIVGETLDAAELYNALLHCADSGEVVGIDTETSGINPKDQAAASGVGRIECWSVSCKKYPRIFLWANQLEFYRDLLESNKLRKCGHNIWSFDYHMFANHDIKLAGIVGDTLIMSRLLYCSKERSHGLKPLALHWLGIKQPSFDSLFMRPKHRMEFVQESRKRGGKIELLEYRETKRKVGDQKGVPTTLFTGERGFFGKALEYIPLSEIPEHYPERLEALYDYASADALITRLLYKRFSEELAKEEWKIAK